MRENSSKIAINNWKNGIFTSEQSIKNLGKWAYTGRYEDICHIHGKTIFMSNNCLLCNPRVAGSTGKEYRIFNDNSPCDNRCPDFENCIDINDAKINNLLLTNPLKNYLGVCEQYVLNHSGIFSPLWYIFNQININCNSNCENINICKNITKENKNKNIFGFCDIVADKLHGKVKYCKNLYCNICNKETLHKYNTETKELYCQVCAGEKVWCKIHEQFEAVNYNSSPNHGLFYKTKTTKWIKDFYEEFEYIQSVINVI